MIMVPFLPRVVAGRNKKSRRPLSLRLVVDILASGHAQQARLGKVIAEPNIAMSESIHGCDGTRGRRQEQGQSLRLKLPGNRPRKTVSF
jgi:hypothetical protein